MAHTLAEFLDFIQIRIIRLHPACSIQTTGKKIFKAPSISKWLQFHSNSNTSGLPYFFYSLYFQWLSNQTQQRLPRKPEQMGFLRQTLLRFAELAPEAFRPATPEVAQCLERVGRNFRADGRAPGGGWGWANEAPGPQGASEVPIEFNRIKQEGFMSRYYRGVVL